MLGLVTDRDLVSRGIAEDKDLENTEISEIMTTDIDIVKPDSELSEVSKKMCDCQIKRIPVVENNELIGIVTLGDLANNENISSSDVGSTTKKICNCKTAPKNAE